MGTIAVSVILNRASKTLLDETNVAWADTELLDYLRAGINAIVANKPDASVKNVAFLVVAGSKQTIPNDGIQQLDVVRNLGASGNTPGKVIRQVERTALDHSDPDWHLKTGPEVLHFCSDKRDPRTFYLYPARVPPWSIELVYVAHPARIENENSILPIDDLYENPLHAFVVAHAYAKNTKRQDLNKFQAYMAIFAQSIGAKTQVQFAFAPVPADVDNAQDR